MEKQAEIEIMSESGSLSHTAVCVNEHARRCVYLGLALAREDAETVRKLIDEETARKFLDLETREDAEEEEEAEGSPLWVACELGFLSVLPELWGTSPEHSRIRSLYAAVRSDNPDVVKEILELSRRESCTMPKKLAFTPDEDGNNPLHIAAKKGNREIMEMLLNEFPELVLTVNKQRRNVLHIGVENRQMDVVKYLLERPEWKYLARTSDKNSETFLQHGNQWTLEDIAELLAIFQSKTEPTAKNLIEEIGYLQLEKEKDIIIQDINKSREGMAMTATLLATMSYQGVLSGITASGADAKNGPALRDNKHFKNFVFFNSTALSLSLLVLASLTIFRSTLYHPSHAYTNRRDLVSRRVTMHYVDGAIVAGVICVFASYAYGLRALSLYDKNVLFSVIASSVWMIEMAFIRLRLTELLSKIFHGLGIRRAKMEVIWRILLAITFVVVMLMTHYT